MGNGAGTQDGESAARLYKTMYDVWVRSTSEMLNEAMQSPQFARLMGKSLEGALDFKKQMDEAWESSLRGLQLPTASDMAALSGRLRALEDEVRVCSQKMDVLKTMISSPPSPPSAGKRPTRRAP